ncbi:hypothetical protein [Demequina sp. NBRC 110057]|uniref:hypothetical protein n=1 Tax=Demequina sp. NBRC 110057 TaxID=1570346 RepID=UPI0009FF503B|nr:hypothetical protein [Demequina sp. NBRC 110057]
MGINAWLVVLAIAAAVVIALYLKRHADRWPQAIFVGLGVFALLFAVKWGADGISAFEWVAADD